MDKILATFMGSPDPSPAKYLRDAAYLNSLPEEKAMKLIIDSYRMRIEDEYAMNGEAFGLYEGEDPVPDFIEYLDMAEKKGGILPHWWNPKKRSECFLMARTSSDCNLGHAVQKQDIIDTYGDRLMPMKIRMIAEMVTEVKIGMQFSTSIYVGLYNMSQ